MVVDAHEIPAMMIADDTVFIRLIALKAALKLELRGLIRGRGLPSAYSILRREYGYRGSREKVLAQVERDTNQYALRKRGDVGGASNGRDPGDSEEKTRGEEN